MRVGGNMAKVEYEVGDVITYKNFGGQVLTGEVSSKEDDIKNGRPGFDLVLGVWGYDSQITHVNGKLVGRELRGDMRVWGPRWLPRTKGI